MQRYTIVSATYNVEKYLDDYFQSLIQQTRGFSNIIVVMVDDGSTDSSAEIIKRWQADYPENIVYLYKENGGQASARNFGLQYVETDWVTFIDPDDFLDERYFEEVDRAISARSDLQMVSCNCIYYREERGEKVDRHPLRYRYREAESYFSVDDQDQHIQLSVSSAFFRTKVIKENGLLFDERIRPNFEDAHFVGRYLAYLNGGSIGFLKNARYFYRKRSDKSSSLDTGWADPHYFNDGLRYGCLDLLESYRRDFGRVPKNIQRSVLYHLSWQIKGLIDSEERASLLDEVQKHEYFMLLKEIFALIDAEIILSFEGRFLEFYCKAGILKLLKGIEPPYQIAYIEDVDIKGREVLLRAFCEKARFCVNGKPVEEFCGGRINHTFIGHTFVSEHFFRVPYCNEDDVLSFDAGEGCVAKIRVRGELFKGSVGISQVRAILSENKSRSIACSGRSKECFYMEKQTPRISVIVPVFNAERHLQECLDSLVAQTFRNFEIICVNDGSTDSSLSLLEGYAAQDHRFSVITQQNAGVAVARNRGIEAASGEYVYFLDADDFIVPSLLAEVLEAVHKYNADVCIFGFDNYYTESGCYESVGNFLRREEFRNPVFSYKDAPDRIFRLTNPSVWNKLFRRSLINDAQMRFVSELRYAQDVPFTYGLLVRASRITALNKVFYHYRRDAVDSLMKHSRGLAPCNALSALDRDLHNLGVFSDVQRAFENLVMDQACYTFEIATTSDEFVRLHEAYSQRWVSGFPKRPNGYYFRRSHAELASSIAQNDTVASCVLIQRATRQSAAMLRQRLVQHEQKVAELKKQLASVSRHSCEVSSIRNSHSYRIGRHITATPRLFHKGVRMLLRRLRQLFKMSQQERFSPEVFHKEAEDN